jgi:hypothetical protein
VLEPTSKSWSLPQKVEGRKKKIQKKGAGWSCPGIDPRPAGDRWLPPGPGPKTGGRRPLVAGLPVTNGRGLVAVERSDPDHWSPTAWWPGVAHPRSLVQGRSAISGRPPDVGRHLDRVALVLFFWIFFFFEASSYTLVNFLLDVWGMGQGFWENGCTVHPFFQASPFTWKCQIFHSA